MITLPDILTLKTSSDILFSAKKLKKVLFFSQESSGFHIDIHVFANQVLLIAPLTVLTNFEFTIVYFSLLVKK